MSETQHKMMIDVGRHPSGSVDAGCRHLAVRVIEQAFRDLCGSCVSQADQESARAFLAGSRMLYRWCEIANLSAIGTIARAKELEGAFPSAPQILAQPPTGGHDAGLGVQPASQYSECG